MLVMFGNAMMLVFLGEPTSDNSENRLRLGTHDDSEKISIYRSKDHSMNFPIKHTTFIRLFSGGKNRKLSSQRSIKLVINNS